jgi:hypothetical protein
VRQISRLALGLLLGCSVLAAARAFVVETRDAVAGFEGRPLNIGPFFWRSGMAPTERLARCLDEARALLPAGSVVAFASAPGPDDAAFYRWRWAAYLLPGIHLVRLEERHASPPARYVLTYRVQVDEHGLALVRQLPGGRLYRVLD